MYVADNCEQINMNAIVAGVLYNVYRSGHKCKSAVVKGIESCLIRY